jgi:HSP20 family protein
MRRRSAAQKLKASTPVKLVPVEDLFHRVQEMHYLIAQRAHELFENRGRAGGFDLEDWFRAESEFLYPLQADIAESDDAVLVRAGVPGFSAEELQVSVEPRRVTISGKREASKEHMTERIVERERGSDHIFRVLDLPAEIDPSKVNATLRGTALQLEMKKAVPAGEASLQSKGK